VLFGLVDHLLEALLLDREFTFSLELHWFDRHRDTAVMQHRFNRVEGFAGTLIIQDHREFGAFVGVGEDNLGTDQIEVGCIERIEKIVHALFEYRLENFDHIVGDEPDKAVDKAKSDLFGEFAVAILIELAVVGFEKGEGIFDQCIGGTVLIRIACLILFEAESFLRTDRDEAEVAVAGVDDTFEKHRDLIVESILDLPIEGDGCQLVVE